uniref:TIL domain-containing protein n=1 Tax=Panagrolaimus sp. PS1159 TaxID=55785 RepID=A0AC35FDC0_9BILA
MAILNNVLTIIFTFLLFSFIALGERERETWDFCQDNEVYIECGGCEGTCKEPVIANCSSICKPARCECQALEGFVRSHDGACIKFDDCSTYVGIEIYGDPTNYKMLSKGPMAAIPSVLNNQPSPAEDYPQTENNFQKNSMNYEDETEAPGTASDNQFQVQTHNIPPSFDQQQSPPNENYHPAKISGTDPYEPSVNSNQYRRRFRHKF